MNFAFKTVVGRRDPKDVLKEIAERRVFAQTEQPFSDLM